MTREGEKLLASVEVPHFACSVFTAAEQHFICGKHRKDRSTVSASSVSMNQGTGLGQSINWFDATPILDGGLHFSLRRESGEDVFISVAMATIWNRGRGGCSVRGASVADGTLPREGATKGPSRSGRLRRCSSSSRG